MRSMDWGRRRKPGEVGVKEKEGEASRRREGWKGHCQMSQKGKINVYMVPRAQGAIL